MTRWLPHHTELQLMLGAYVLGGLGAADRRLLDEHLPTCPACTAELSRFAVVPGLLRLAPPIADDAEPTAPPESLPRLIDAVRAQRATRRRHRWLLTAAVLVVLVTAAGVVGVMQVRGAGSTPPPTAVVSTFNNATVGQAVLAPKEWGTEVRLTLDYKPRGSQPYTAWAVSRNGRQEQAATWTTPPGGHCSVTGATSIQHDQLDHVEIRTADGRTLLRTH
jgi:anti-sigma factor RsiW